MYAIIFLVFNLIFTLIYFFTKKNYKNLNSFIDAFYYSLNVSTSVGYGDIIPETDTGKITTMIQSLFVYFSVSKFVFQSQPNFMIFAIANVLLIAGMTYAYKQLDNTLGKSYIDYAYFTTITHSTVGFGDHKKPLNNKTKMLVSAHILLVFLLLNTYNNGIFSHLRTVLFKHSNANMSMKFT